MPTRIPLNTLDPRWLVADGQRVGFIFRCPMPDKSFYQSCMFQSVGWREQHALFTAALADLQIAEGKNPEHGWTRVQGVTGDAYSNITWLCSPDPDAATFDNITVHPSIDGSAGGLWHGWIQDGHAVFLD
ncbi:hypothetical protein [Ralstonia phage phiRSL1]|uniref:Uncharacterized protein n=1 Tax=Ralstonia phage phiRSL1 TaxID=1980924 RepID=B2ZY77_9CAUD|nr:hypothetical protein RSL1_ORF265 [Ralstonia phage phiRSL1]BAG41712.1 hypothetical protein [Ralstonia phage phiRSL1]